MTMRLGIYKAVSVHVQAVSGVHYVELDYQHSCRCLGLGQIPLICETEPSEI